jgi:hypothetical protein
MRILLPALLLLLLLSGCTTVDGEPVASESVAADAATWNPRTGYADKKYQKAIEMIRQGIQSGDDGMVKKGHKALSDLILGEQSFGELWNETMAGRPGRATAARRMVSDIVMRIIQEETGLGMPGVEEAMRLGLIAPNELIPGKQTQKTYRHLIPQEPFGFTPEGIPLTSTKLYTTPAQPGQKPTIRLVPDARLTPTQYESVQARLRGLSAGLAIRKELAESNQRDKASDFSETWSDQQQYSVFQQPQQLIPTPGGRALLGPITPNAYGPGLNSDATGRPFLWQPDFGGPAMGPITPNAYGPGIGMDGTGRPVRPACPPGMLC